MKKTFIDVEESEFISELNLWIYKTGKHPLELITFTQAKNNMKLIAIPSYIDSGNWLFLGDKSYSNYQQALARVGSIFDKMDIKLSMQEHVGTHPISYPQKNA